MGLKTSYDTCRTSWPKDLFQRIQESQITFSLLLHTSTGTVCVSIVHTEILKSKPSMGTHSVKHLRLQDRYDVSRLTADALSETTCSDYHKICLSCGTKLLTSHLLPLLDYETNCVLVQVGDCPQDGYARLTNIKKDGTFEELVDTLVQYLEALSCQLFNSKWQWKAYCFMYCVLCIFVLYSMGQWA